jgi:hypothetical protein
MYRYERPAWVVLMPSCMGCRMDRNMQIAGGLQNMLLGGLLQFAGTPRRSPCPHAMSAQLTSPSALSYMARSRFGPSLLNALLQVSDLLNRQVIVSFRTWPDFPLTVRGLPEVCGVI